MVDRVPAEEWRQIFDEVWRRYRDWFYVENMHGYDWEALREQYEPLLAARRAPLRPELRDRRDDRRADRAARLHRRRRLRDPAAAARRAARRALRARQGGGRYTHRARSSTARTRRSIYRSPLTEIGVDVDGRRLRARHRRRGAAGERRSVPAAAQQGGSARCTLTVNAKPTMEGARTVTFSPIDERERPDLPRLGARRTAQRVERADRTAASATCTCPTWAPTASASSSSGTTAQIRKEGLIVDVRANGGGNVSRMLIERLRRQLLGARITRAPTTAPAPYPGRRVPRPDGRDPQRELGVGRRHLPGDVPRGGARAR